MIDETLAKLSRDLIAASDKLASDDFQKRQARFIALEAERAELAEGLEADEAAVVAAQEALQAHFAQDRVYAGGGKPAGADGPEETTVDVEDFFRPVFDRSPALDEFSSSRANGAYTED